MEHYLTAIATGAGSAVVVGCRCGWVKVTSWSMLSTAWREHLDGAVEEAGW